MKHIAIFASGNGTNAENIIKHFQDNTKGCKVSVVICNRKEAGVYERASRLGVNALYLPKSEINDHEKISDVLRNYKIDFIVLAGFLLMIPDFLLNDYPQRIVNIHPSLLPKYGGKGMHGRHVHEAVVKNGEKESGITIHYVNEKCDEGMIIFQASTPIDSEDTADDVESKVHDLEKRYFPEVIEKLILKL